MHKKRTYRLISFEFISQFACHKLLQSPHNTYNRKNTKNKSGNASILYEKSWLDDYSLFLYIWFKYICQKITIHIHRETLASLMANFTIKENLFNHENQGALKNLKVMNGGQSGNSIRVPGAIMIFQ